MNQRNFQIPIQIQPERLAEIKELILYMSKDEGRPGKSTVGPNRNRKPSTSSLCKMASSGSVFRSSITRVAWIRPTSTGLLPDRKSSSTPSSRT
jgi:hypothetical protein